MSQNTILGLYLAEMAKNLGLGIWEKQKNLFISWRLFQQVQQVEQYSHWDSFGRNSMRGRSSTVKLKKSTVQHM